MVTSMPTSVIVAVNDLAATEGLQMKMKSGNTLYDSAWIAGVDHDDHDDEEEDKNNDDEDNDNKNGNQYKNAEMLYADDDPIQAETNKERFDAAGEEADAEFETDFDEPK